MVYPPYLGKLMAQMMVPPYHGKHLQNNIDGGGSFRLYQCCHILEEKKEEVSLTSRTDPNLKSTDIQRTKVPY